jgi:hypothetical protein
LLAEVAVTLVKYVAEGLGLGTRVQAVPFQCRIRVLVLPMEPTAQALLAEVAAMADRTLWEGRFGAGTCLQAVPFQCRIKVLLLPVEPIAQALLAEVAATLYRTALPAGLGLATRFQAVPFQCRIRVFVLVLLPVKPTAQALVAEVATTPESPPLTENAAGARTAAPAAEAVTGATPPTTPASSSDAATSWIERAARLGMRTAADFITRLPSSAVPGIMPPDHDSIAVRCPNRRLP